MIDALFVGVHALLALFLFARWNRVSVILAYLAYLIAYDYVFLHLEAWLDREVLVGKLLGEALLLSALATVGGRRFTSATWSGPQLMAGVAIAAAAAIGLATSRVAIGEAMIDARTLIAPLAIALLFSTAVRIGPNEARAVRRTLLALGVGVVAMGVAQFATFDGNLDSAWRYEFLLNLKLEQNPDYPEHLAQHSVIRHGMLRASGPFISAIEFSMFVASIGLLGFVGFVRLRKRRYLWIVVAAVVGIAVSQVRIGFFALALGMLLTVLFGFRTRIVRAVALAAPAVSIVAVFGYVIWGGGLNDPSTLGRIPQYALGLERMSLLGHGFGSYHGRFDSYYIYAGLTLGVGALLILAAVVGSVARLERVDRHGLFRHHDPEQATLVRYALVNTLVLFVVFSVHHTAGGMYYFMSFLLLFSALRAGREPSGAPPPVHDAPVPGGRDGS